MCCLQAIAAQKRREAEQAEEMANNRIAALTAGQQAVQQHQTQSQAKMEEARGHALNAQQARSGSGVLDIPGQQQRVFVAPHRLLRWGLHSAWLRDMVAAQQWAVSHCKCLAVFQASALLSGPTSENNCSKQPSCVHTNTHGLA